MGVALNVTSEIWTLFSSIWGTTKENSSVKLYNNTISILVYL